MGAATLAMNIPRLGGRTRSPIFPISKVRHDGLRVGPVGSTIISEVFVGLVHGDHNSFLWQVKNWKPTLPSQTTGNFTMTDMLRFVNDINPIGD